jgi:bifunctional non-homologous end joining protein LigD
MSGRRRSPHRVPVGVEAIQPMLATPATSLPADGSEWAYEVKWDGVRAIAFLSESGAARLQSRTLLDLTAQFPDLVAPVREHRGDGAVLDGEVVAFDLGGHPSFERLQQRINVSTPSQLLVDRIPVAYIAFDVLRRAGQDLTPLAYLERRRILAELTLPGPGWQAPGHHLGDGAAFFEATRAQGLEGVVAKRRLSVYEAGKRSHHWVKVKNIKRQELVVGGWLPGEGSRRGSLGALLVGYHDEAGSLRYAGRVGSGFSDAELARLNALLSDRAAAGCPFDLESQVPSAVRRSAHWVAPTLVVEVAFTGWTAAGVLRQPSYKGLRPDRPAQDVRREP